MDRTKDENSERTNNKKVIYYVALLFAAIGLIVLLGILLVQKEDDPDQASKAQDAELAVVEDASASPSPTLRFATEDYAYNLNEDGELERIFETAEDERLVAVSEDRESFVYYQQTYNTEQNTHVDDSLYFRSDGQDNFVLNLNDIEGDVNLGDLSADASKIIYWTYGDTEEIGLLETGYIDLISGEKVVYNSSQSLDGDSQFLLPVSWLDSDRVLANRLVCVRCSGPSLPDFHILEEGMEPLNIINAKDVVSSIEYPIIKGLAFDEEESKIYAMFGDLGLVGVPDSATVSASKNFVYSFNIDGSNPKLVHTEHGVFANLVNLSNDGEELIISIKKPNPKFTHSSTDESPYLGPPIINFVNIKDGTTEIAELLVDGFSNLSAYMGPIAYDEQNNSLYFSMTSTTNLADSSQGNQTIMYQMERNGESQEVIDLYNMIDKGRIIELDVR